mgnify:FL=1
MAEMPFDINTLSEEQRRILLGQLQGGQMPQMNQMPSAPELPTITDQEDRGFLKNFAQRRILNPLQVRLGLRDSPQDVLRKQQSILNQYELQGMQQDRQRDNQAVDYIRGLTEEQGQALGLNAAQLALAKANPMQSYDDIVSRSFARETFSTTPQFGMDATGGRIAYQLSDRGGAKVLDYTPSQEYRTIDDGQSIQVYDKYSDKLIQTIPKQMTPEQQERLIIEKRKETKEDKEKQQARIKGLRTEFNNLTKTDREIAVAFQKVQKSAQNPSAASDVALIFAYMKLLDPGSVVREGEFATAQNSGSVPDRVVAQYNRARTGERLPEEVRQDFLRSAELVIAPYREQFEATKIRYSTLAEQQGLQPSQVIINDPYSNLQQYNFDDDYLRRNGLRGSNERRK